MSPDLIQIKLNAYSYQNNLKSILLIFDQPYQLVATQCYLLPWGAELPKSGIQNLQDLKMHYTGEAIQPALIYTVRLYDWWHIRNIASARNVSYAIIMCYLICTSLLLPHSSLFKKRKKQRDVVKWQKQSYVNASFSSKQDELQFILNLRQMIKYQNSLQLCNHFHLEELTLKGSYGVVEGSRSGFL